MHIESNGYSVLVMDAINRFADKENMTGRVIAKEFYFKDLDITYCNDKYSALVGLQIFEGSKLKNEFIKNAKSKSKYSVCKIH